MKLLLVCLLAFLQPIFSGAQRNTCQLKIITDKLASTKIAYTPVVPVSNGSNKMDLHFYKTGHSIVFSVMVTSEELFCVDHTSSAVILFSDKSSIILKASNTSNCTGNFQFSFYDNVPSTDVEVLASKSIVSINIIGKNHEAGFKENDDEARRIRYYFKCIKDLVL